MNTHSIDLAALTRIQLQDLASDVARELESKEHDDRIQLEESLRSMIESAGFDPKDLQFSPGRKPKRKTGKQSKEKPHED